MAFDYTDPEIQVKLCTSLRVEIDEYADSHHDGGFRTHLGGSVVGHDCARHCFYNFRWVAKDVPNRATPERSRGQMRRLHQRGHLEEPVVFDYLRGIGFVVLDKDPTTGKQFRISDHGGHFGGSLDARGFLPPKYGLTDEILIEVKTSNYNQFRDMKKRGLIIEKPQHWRQMCIYGYKQQIKWGLYIVVNKNDDEMYMEFHQLDWSEAQVMDRKALAVIQCDPKLPPPKYSLNSADFKCKMCDFVDVCQFGKPVEVNCRSCIHSQAIDQSKWYCNKYKQELSDDLISVGCKEHEGIAPETTFGN